MFNLILDHFDENTRGALLAIDPNEMYWQMLELQKIIRHYKLRLITSLAIYYVEFIDYGNELYDYAKFSISG